MLTKSKEALFQRSQRMKSTFFSSHVPWLKPYATLKHFQVVKRKGLNINVINFLVTSKINTENVYINDKKITKVIYVFNKTLEIKHCFGMTKEEN